ncbi:MAG: tetratricopeptide repeat protein [Anaerolineae bacterium]|nr:tetratricopeptide repeat protein [Anaerolineae bacterium]MDW8071959.1 tetratricopeptide repeat protein [Anaerolineae bacterium]
MSTGDISEEGIIADKANAPVARDVGQSAVPGVSCSSEPQGLRVSPRWIRIAASLLLLFVLVWLAYPSVMRTLFTPETVPSDQTAVPQVTLQDEAAQYQVALEHYQAGQFAEAWTALRRVPSYVAALEANPEIEAAEQAVQSAPTSAQAHFKLGAAWVRANLLTLAEAAFRKAIALDAQHVDAYVNLGVTLYQMGRLDEALQEYDAALAIAPNDAALHHNKGAVYVQQALQSQPPDKELLDKGLRAFQRALELDAQLPQAYFSLGVVYDLQGKRQEALAMFRRFQELDDGSDPQATALARQYIEKLEQAP